MNKRILAVDPGDKRIGLAISDPSGVISNPLLVINHVAREKDAEVIALKAIEYGVVKIVIGQALDQDGMEGPRARKSLRLGEAVKNYCDIPVVYWDESGSTKAVRQARMEMGVSRRKRQGHMDDLAAAYILQSYLDANIDGEQK